MYVLSVARCRPPWLPDKVKESHREYRVNNPEKIKETHREYRAKNPEKATAKRKERDESDGEEMTGREKRSLTRCLPPPAVLLAALSAPRHDPAA